MPFADAKLSMLVNEEEFHGQLKSFTGAAGSVVLHLSHGTLAGVELNGANAHRPPGGPLACNAVETPTSIFFFGLIWCARELTYGL